MAQTTCEAEKGGLVECAEYMERIPKKKKKLTIPSLRSQKYNREQEILPESIFGMPGPRICRCVNKASHSSPTIKLIHGDVHLENKRPYRAGDGVGTEINWQITNGLRIFFGVYPAGTPYVGLVGD